MHTTGNAQKEHELITRAWKPKHQQTPEGFRSLWNQPITRRFSKKQPIRTPRIKRCWQTLKQPSSINTATFALKISLIKDSLCRSPGVAVKPLREPKRQQWSGKTGLSEWIFLRLAQKKWLVRLNLCQTNSENWLVRTKLWQTISWYSGCEEWSFVRLLCTIQIAKMKVLSVYIVKTVLQLCNFVRQGDAYVQDETI